MVFDGFIGPAYNLRNFAYDSQTLKNWLIEANEVQKGKGVQPAQFTPRAGLLPVLTSITGSSRGGYLASTGDVYWMFGGDLIKITTSTDTSAWSYTTASTGTILNGAEQAQMTDNGVDLFILSNGGVYAYNFATGVTTALTTGAFADYTPASSMTFIDNYIVFSQADSNRFFWTNLGSTVAAGLNFASAEANPEHIVGVINNNLDLWIMGRKSIEIWYNYGQNNIVFARRGNLLIETGCLAANSIQKINNTIMWLAGDDRGGAQVVIANGYSPNRVSTFPIEQQLQTFTAAQLEAASAYTMQLGGHQLYVLNVPGSDETFVYDLTVSQQLGKQCWCVFTSSDGAAGISRHLANDHVYANGFHISGDYQAGNLYAWDEDTFTDNENYIQWERTTPHISNEMKRVFYDAITIDFATGVAEGGITPSAMLQYSNDGGATWSDARVESTGNVGEFGLKVEWRRNGSGRNRVWRLRCTDAIYWALCGAYIDMRPGAH